MVGPTATGKSDLALDLAEQAQASGPAARAEIINADASLLYRGMDIGTAKPSPAERSRVPHHQIDVLTVRDRASVAAFQRSARGDIDAVESRGHLPIIVGGSGLYVRALTDDLDFPGTDPQIRAALEARAAAVGGRALWEELRRADPAAAERIEAANTRRVVRALEVLAVTGRPFSATLPRYEDLVPTVHLALRPERAALKDTAGVDPLEARAKEAGLNYVRLDGQVGVLGNGAGLVMSTLDVVAAAGRAHGGMRPANFLDLGGGSSAEMMATGLEVVASDPQVRAILVNVFGGITSCDTIAEGIVTAVGSLPDFDRPIVVRLDGNNAELGRRILAEAAIDGVRVVDTMDGAADVVTAIAQRVTERPDAERRDAAARPDAEQPDAARRGGEQRTTAQHTAVQQGA